MQTYKETTNHKENKDNSQPYWIEMQLMTQDGDGEINAKRFVILLHQQSRNERQIFTQHWNFENSREVNNTFVMRESTHCDLNILCSGTVYNIVLLLSIWKKKTFVNFVLQTWILWWFNFTYYIGTFIALIELRFILDQIQIPDIMNCIHCNNNNNNVDNAWYIVEYLRALHHDNL